ncbi:hypothetical protein H4582DRAFT_1768197, partial [Lactarius indigo]
IFQIPKLGTKLITHPNNTYFYIIEYDHRVLGVDAAGKKVQELASKAVEKAVFELPSEQFGHPKVPAGTWGSCVRIPGRDEHKTIRVVRIDNDAAFSLAAVPFEAQGNELHLVVGTARDTLPAPRSYTSGFLRVYKFSEDEAG